MNTNQKLNQTILDNLKSGSPAKISSAIEEIKNIAGTKYLPFIIETLSNYDDDSIHKTISEFLFNLKEESAVTYIIDGIKNNQNKDILPILVSSCWQCGLSYKEYFVLFTEIFIESELVVAIESFSVIETVLDELNSKERQLIIDKVESSSNKMDSTKQSFATSLIDMIKGN